MQDLANHSFEPSGVRIFAGDSIPLHDAINLTQGGNLARIQLSGQVYALRITRQGKLILTK